MDLRYNKLRQLNKEELFLYIAFTVIRHLKIEDPTWEQIRAIYRKDVPKSRIRKILIKLSKKNIIPRKEISSLLEERREKNTDRR